MSLILRHTQLRMLIGSMSFLLLSIAPVLVTTGCGSGPSGEIAKEVATSGAGLAEVALSRSGSASQVAREHTFELGSTPPSPQATNRYDYEVPLASTSPWPQMRRNRFNNGRSPVIPLGDGKPWRFETGKGIFSTPVIGHDQTILIGSGDRNFYAINPDGTEKWRFVTGEIIDSAAAVGADGTIYVPSGDGHLYALTPEGKEKWNFEASHMVGQPSQNEGTSCCEQSFGLFGFCHPESGTSNWFEGNVSIGKNGTLWAGNDNHRLYGISPEGKLLINFWPAHWFGYAANWTAPATLRDGSVVFGSLNSNIYSIQEDGTCKWRNWIGSQSINDMLTSSPAISDDETTVYAGSWDKQLHALDLETGLEKWAFPTRGHIYSSPAISKDGTVVFASTDGSVYALTPNGELLWTYDTIDPIRSSPSIAGDGTIFFGAGDGVLYALNADGTRRWSFDTTVQERNDLNSSPALGETSVYIGSEDGSVIAVPYSYCENNPSDSRCSLNPQSDLPKDGARLYYVTTGGRSLLGATTPIQRKAMLSFRLILRANRRIHTGELDISSLKVTSTPAAQFQIVTQAGNDLINLVPKTFLEQDTQYTIEIQSEYADEDTSARGQISQTFTFQTVAERHAPPDLQITEHHTPAFEIKNLAPFQPKIITSLNQIGFDSVNFLSSVIHETEQGAVLWLVSGLPDGQITRIDPHTPSITALDAQFDGSSFVLQGSNLELITGGPVLQTSELQIASQLDANGSFDVGTSFFARSSCFGGMAPSIGVYFWWLSECNTNNDLAAIGTIRATQYRGSANQRPLDVSANRLYLTGDEVIAELSATNFQKDEHLAGIILFDESTGRVIPLNYAKSLSSEADENGNISKLRLSLSGHQIDRSSTIAIVVTDLYPIYKQKLSDL